jgi:hypothetical protein
MKFCRECGIEIIKENKGKWSPYFCEDCDRERINRVSKQFEKIAKEFKIREVK